MKQPIIPGQSLTAEPKNAPYENPPQVNTPEDGIMWHLDRLVEPERLDALLDMLELGLDVVTLTEGLLRSAVLQGIHSVDISLIIAPVIHEFIVTTAEKADIEFEEGFPDDSEEKMEIKYQVKKARSRKALRKAGYGASLKDKQTDTAEDSPSPQEAPAVEPVEEEMKAPAGLMARKGDTV